MYFIILYTLRIFTLLFTNHEFSILLVFLYTIVLDIVRWTGEVFPENLSNHVRYSHFLKFLFFHPFGPVNLQRILILALLPCESTTKGWKKGNDNTIDKCTQCGHIFRICTSRELIQRLQTILIRLDNLIEIIIALYPIYPPPGPK